MNGKNAIAIFCLCLLISCSKSLDNPVAEPQQTANTEQESKYEQGIAVIKLTDDMSQLVEADFQNGQLFTKSMSFNNIVDELGIISIDRLFPDAGEFEERTRAAGLHKWYKITYDKSIAQTKAASEFSSVEGVEIYEPRAKARLNSLPFNDPYLSSQWHFYNNGTLSSTKAGADINVLPVWEKYKAGDPDVIVAVVDAGVSLAHPDLAANVNSSKSKSFVSGYSNIVPDHHGTHVAGTIAAVNNNGIGVCGVAGGNAAKGEKGTTIISCQCFVGNTSGDFESAIKWAADNGAVICQNSWGYNFSSYVEAKFFKNPSSLIEAIEYFNKNAGMDKNGKQVGPMAGGLVCFAAGNDGWDIGHPGDYEGVLAVGAIDAEGARAYYSNYGSWVDIAAPGGSYLNHQVLSTIKDGLYDKMQGTSMACPHVSGVAALVVAQCGGLGFTRQMLIDKLVSSSNKTFISPSLQIGGLVDAYAAVMSGDAKKPNPVTDLEVTGKSNTLTVGCSVPAGADGQAAFGIQFLYGTDKNKILASDPKSPGAGVTSIKFNTTASKVGDKIQTSVKVDKFDTLYYFLAYSYSGGQVFAEKSNLAEYKVAPNNPPVITCKYTSSLVFRAYQKAVMPFNVTEPDGHKFEVSFVPGSDAAVMSRLDEKGDFDVYINAANADPGKYQLEVKASDEYGATSTKKMEYTILENQPPKVVKQIDNQLIGLAGSKIAFSVKEFFHDEDEEELVYLSSGTHDDIINHNIYEGTLTLTSMKQGQSSITVTAMDAKGKTATTTFEVLSRDPSAPVDLYPNPVSTYLNVRPAKEAAMNVTIFNKVGAKLYSGSAEPGPFKPMKIDMSSYAAGVYVVKVETASDNLTYSVVKQ